MPDSTPARHCRLSCRHPGRRGFTLTEMLISVALVLVLMLAITRIFSITSTTIGASQGFAAATRDARAAQAVFARDISSLAPDSPFIWIRSDLPTIAFRNADDADTDRDKSAGTTDVDNNGTEGEATVAGENEGVYATDTRSHRLDRLSFCVRDRYLRQTGNNGATDPTKTVTNPSQLVDDLSSPEAWITYGHVTLPFANNQFGLDGTVAGVPAVDDAGTVVTGRTYPGFGNAAADNPLNYYASQWILGRAAMVMVRPVSSTTGTGADATSTSSISDSAGYAQEFYGKRTGATAKRSDLEPFADTTGVVTPSGNIGSAAVLYNARYDLLGTDITTARTTFDDYIKSAANNTQPWYTVLRNYRFEASPYTIKPITPRSASQQVPMFVPACAQFIVEYAGDFVTQNPDGTLNPGTAAAPVAHAGLTPDGQIDFRYDPATGSRQIQWFGMPRSPGGTLTVSPAKGDVVPLGEFVHYISDKLYTDLNVMKPARLQSYATTADLRTKPATDKNDSFAAFEHFIVYNKTTGEPTERDHTFPKKPKHPDDDVYGAYLADPADPQTDPTYFQTYYAAFDPGTSADPDRPRPRMIRITMTIDRPELAGRSADAQPFEYVFSLP